MDRQADVLKDRVQAIALDRRIGDTGEGIGSRQHEQGKAGGDPGLDAQGARPKRRRDIPAEIADEPAEKHQDQHP